MNESLESEPRDPPHRVVGWKAIASYLKVSPRTAVRWTDTYGLPVHRIPRGSRPLIFAWAAELDAWHTSPDAARARVEEVSGGTPAGESPLADAIDQARSNRTIPSPGTPEADDGGPRIVRSRRWGLALLAVIGAGTAIAYGCGFWHMTRAPLDRALPPSRTARNVHGAALSQDEIRLSVALAGQSASTVTIRPGDVVRAETGSVRLGLQARQEGDRLRVLAYRLEALARGEAAKYLLTRHLTRALTESLEVEGAKLELTWLASTTQPDRDGPRPQLQPCCLVCDEVTVCGESVSSLCGRCQGKQKDILAVSDGARQ